MTDRRLFLETRLAPSEEGVFEGHAAVFGERNWHGEIVQSGAFKRTIAEHASRGINPPMLLHHDPRNIGGTWTELREDGRGLFVRGQFAMRTTAGKEAYELASMGALTGISIGFRERAGKDVGSVRHLTDIDLVEISLVALPSADGSRIKSVRADSGLAAFITAAREAASFIRTH